MKRRQVFSEINITPLTDVFLVLLIIMMVVAPILDHAGLKLAVPSVGPSADVKDQPKVIHIRIDEKNQYFIQQGTGAQAKNDLTGSAVLSSTIKQLKIANPEGVVIDVHPDATHGALTFAMDAAEAAGVSKIAVMSSEEEQQNQQQQQAPDAAPEGQ